ncbi:MAG: ABC transporter ATP-binding protein [Candidatus Sumerlaeia bacterium]|nr:ABC transporter ATP-binding protein [Candidatus Sumerlaeia bacterium]
MNSQETASQSAPLLQIKNLCKTYHRNGGQVKPLFHNLSFDMASNEVVGVIGHSGSGKSTILNMIAGLEKFDSGVITVNGRTVTKPGFDRMVIFQNYALLPWLTVFENVKLAVDETKPELPAKERVEIAKKYVKLVNLTAASDKKPGELSGGMRQRVGIARALAVRPLLLLMDEPFGALDPFTRGLLQEQVLDLFYAEHQTILLITHDVDEALFMCDRIIILNAGQPSKIAHDLRVPFVHPRDRRELRSSPTFHELRNQILDELERSFILST